MFAGEVARVCGVEAKLGIVLIKLGTEESMGRDTDGGTGT